MTARLQLTWPDQAPFVDRSDPLRLLAVSDEPDPTLESAVTRARIGSVDMVIGCGDLEPDYLGFVADAFGAPLRYVRGNHDVGAAWTHAERTTLPAPLPSGHVIEEAGLRLLGFSGSPRYNQRGMQVSSPEMWLRCLRASMSARRRLPVLVITHAAPRGLNDAPDLAHRGFTSLRWLVDRLHPPLWLHGHTALVRRGLDDRCARHNGTLIYNCTGASLIELRPPQDA